MDYLESMLAPDTDPNLFTIEQKRLFGMYPDIAAIPDRTIPYFKQLHDRFKKPLTVSVYGDTTGEIAYRLLELHPFIDKIFMHIEKNDLIENNLKPYKDKVFFGRFKTKPKHAAIFQGLHPDIVYMEAYKNLVEHGIFMGEGYLSVPDTGTSIKNFRLSNRISQRLNIVYDDVYFWYKITGNEPKAK